MKREIHVEEEAVKSECNVIVTPLTYLNIPEIKKERDENVFVSSGVNPSKWKIVQSARQQILPSVSKGEIKLSSIISELQKFSIHEQIEQTEEMKIINSCYWIRISRRKLSTFFLQTKFHYFVILLVVIDLSVVLVDLVLAQLSSPCLTDNEMIFYNTSEQRDSCLLPYSISLSRGELFLFYFSLFLLMLFVTEVFLSFYAFGWRHYQNPLYLLDGILVFSSFIMELYFHYGNIGRAGRAAAAIVVLRLWKIVRAIHAVAHSITLKNRLLISKIQDAQHIIEQDKQNTEQLLEKQEIKLEYLINLLKKHGKLPSTEQIDLYVKNTWDQRKKDQ